MKKNLYLICQYYCGAALNADWHLTYLLSNVSIFIASLYNYTTALFLCIIQYIYYPVWKQFSIRKIQFLIMIFKWRHDPDYKRHVMIRNMFVLPAIQLHQ